MEPSESDNLEWANHLWEEWKYRHENKWRNLYRSLWAIIIVMTVPWIKTEYYEPISQPSTRIEYGLLPLIIFVAMCIVAAQEFADLKSVQRRLNELRGIYRPSKPDTWEAFRRRPTFIKSMSFILIFLVLWTLWFKKLYHGRQPSPASSQPCHVVASRNLPRDLFHRHDTLPDERNTSAGSRNRVWD